MFGRKLNMLLKINSKTVTVHQQDAILQFVSVPLNPVPNAIEEQFRCSRPLSEHSN